MLVSVCPAPANRLFAGAVLAEEGRDARVERRRLADPVLVLEPGMSYRSGTHRRNRPRRLSGIEVSHACIPFLSKLKMSRTMNVYNFTQISKHAQPS